MKTAVLLGFALVLGASSAQAADRILVDHLSLEGARFTNEEWLNDYLGLTLPESLSTGDAARFERQLLTTGVFTQVKVSFEPDAKASLPNAHTLHIAVKEKWTLLPVLRAAYGGGTPLRVMGIYDSHAFGRLWTLGTETHQYGTAPLGFVAWAHAPRWRGGRGYLGLEFWREFRQRSLYAYAQRDPWGRVDSAYAMVRGTFLGPMPETFFSSAWQGGLEADLRQVGTERLVITANAHSTPGLKLNRQPGPEFLLQPTLVYDDVAVDNLNMDGLRVLLKAGALSTGGGLWPRGEAEAFYYKLLGDDFNLALHGFVGATNAQTLFSQYFLGGFDSVRGLPDGAMFGTHAAYANAELRKIAWRFTYLWIQPVVFADSGAAGAFWQETRGGSSLGLGARFSLPQVNRMVLRIDYAWGVGKGSGHGVSAGLNQFFDPYKPL